MCWAALDDIKNLDISTQSFPRGAYAHWKPSTRTTLRRKLSLSKRLVSIHVASSANNIQDSEHIKLKSPVLQEDLMNAIESHGQDK